MLCCDELLVLVVFVLSWFDCCFGVYVGLVCVFCWLIGCGWLFGGLMLVCVGITDCVVCWWIVLLGALRGVRVVALVVVCGRVAVGCWFVVFRCGWFDFVVAGCWVLVFVFGLGWLVGFAVVVGLSVMIVCCFCCCAAGCYLMLGFA